MKKRKDAVENLARHTTFALVIFFFSTSWTIGAELSVIPAPSSSPQDSLSNGRRLAELQDVKIYSRERSIEKESLMKAKTELIQILEHGGNSAFKVRNYALARKRARQILALDPHRSSALELLASIRKAGNGIPAEKLSTRLFKEETPTLPDAVKEKMAAFFLARGKRLLRKKQYDAAVDEIEKVFILDPLNAKASKLIDRTREEFVREKKAEWKKEAARARENFTDKMELSLNTVKSLIKAKEYMQARVILNRMAFIEPDNKSIRKLMRQIQRLETKEAKAKEA